MTMATKSRRASTAKPKRVKTKKRASKAKTPPRAAARREPAPKKKAKAAAKRKPGKPSRAAASPAKAQRHALHVCDAAFMPPPHISDSARAGGPRRMGAGAGSILDSLDLADVARRAAEILLNHHPELVLTSGRRDSAAQASAMAGNVVRQRNWISLTYRDTPERRALQAWIDTNPQARTRPEIAAGLLQVMGSWSDAQKASLSRHFSGQAFDIRPVAANAEAIKASIRALPNLRKFLEKEGDLVVWHADFA
jgi:hypothetical protein